MATNNNTLAYNVAINFVGNYRIAFMINKTKRIYEYIQTVYDRNTINSTNTVAVCYDTKLQKYVCFNVDDPKVGEQEITIICAY